MKRKENLDTYSDQEVERRATDALRRALTTPYKSQRELTGKTGRSTLKIKKKNRAKP